jgi:signal transduction histidine kinase
VKDSGVGVPKDQILRIFEAYFTTKEKGTGLGLAIVKQNTELYGGEIRVESELGNGTEFILLFPTRALLQDNKS